MKTFLSSTAAVAVLVALGGLTHTALSQQPAAGTPGSTPTVAAIDIGKIFKSHVRLKAMQDQMKKDAEVARAELQKEKERLQAMVEQIKQLKPGTPDYKRMESDIVQGQATLQTRAKLQEKEFAEREAKNYFNIYREVNDEVKNFADYYKINIVLRYNSDMPDINDPQSVLRDINKPIVYLTPGLDITDRILQSINSRGGAPATGQQPAASQPTGLPRR